MKTELTLYFKDKKQKLTLHLSDDRDGADTRHIIDGESYKHSECSTFFEVIRILLEDFEEKTDPYKDLNKIKEAVRLE